MTHDKIAAPTTQSPSQEVSSLGHNAGWSQKMFSMHQTNKDANRPAV